MILVIDGPGPSGLVRPAALGRRRCRNSV